MRENKNKVKTRNKGMTGKLPYYGRLNRRES